MIIGDTLVEGTAQTSQRGEMWKQTAVLLLKLRRLKTDGYCRRLSAGESGRLMSPL